MSMLQIILIGMNTVCFDTFKTQCPSDEIILITYARYGAMKVGKCIETASGK